MNSHSIITASGREFNFTHPEAYPFPIEDIAHALSHICRFGGHTHSFYSVAQHSVLVSHLVPPEHQLAALMHDAAEAYIGDAVTPLKALLPDFQMMEERIERALFAAHGIPLPLPQCVKDADLAALATELRDLTMLRAVSWAGVQAMDMTIVPCSAGQARVAFLTRYRDLMSGRVAA